METLRKNGLLLFLAVCFSAVCFVVFFSGNGSCSPEQSVSAFLFESEGLLSVDGNSYDPDEKLSGSRTMDNRLLWRSACAVPTPFEFHPLSGQMIVFGRVPHLHFRKIRNTDKPRDGPFFI